MGEVICCIICKITYSLWLSRGLPGGVDKRRYKLSLIYHYLRCNHISSQKASINLGCLLNPWWTTSRHVCRAASTQACGDSHTGRFLHMNVTGDSRLCWLILPSWHSDDMEFGVLKIWFLRVWVHYRTPYKASIHNMKISDEYTLQ